MASTVIVVFKVDGSNVIGFVPQEVTIAPGDSVVFRNQDTSPHGVAPDVAGAFAEVGISPANQRGGSSSATITFKDAGEFPYHDTRHPDVHKGIIHVVAAEKPAKA